MRMYTHYDQIGKGYNRTRQADPHIAERLLSLLQAKEDGWYLDIGCGTGNYTNAMAQRGFSLVGIDPSSEMLSQARDRYSHMDWRFGAAEEIPLDDACVDGATAILTTHHWKDLEAGFKELFRVLAPGGNLVLFTSTPEQMKQYWLNHYFPKMLESSCKVMPSLQQTEETLTKAGFEKIETDIHFVTEDLQDLFLQSGKHRPALYLNPEVRSGISSFAALANQAEVEVGLEQLSQDIESGKVNDIIAHYNSALGDYLFVKATKPS